MMDDARGLVSLDVKGNGCFQTGKKERTCIGCVRVELVDAVDRLCSARSVAINADIAMFCAVFKVKRRRCDVCVCQRRNA